MGPNSISLTSTQHPGPSLIPLLKYNVCNDGFKLLDCTAVSKVALGHLFST